MKKTKKEKIKKIIAVLTERHKKKKNKPMLEISTSKDTN